MRRVVVAVAGCAVVVFAWLGQRADRASPAFAAPRPAETADDASTEIRPAAETAARREAVALPAATMLHGLVRLTGADWGAPFRFRLGLESREEWIACEPDGSCHAELPAIEAPLHLLLPHPTRLVSIEPEALAVDRGGGPFENARLRIGPRTAELDLEVDVEPFLDVELREQATGEPLPEVELRAGFEGRYRGKAFPIELDPKARGRLAHRVLLAHETVAFFVLDPQQPGGDCPWDAFPTRELIERDQPLVLELERGPFQPFSVVDRSGQPVAGAFVRHVFAVPAATGSDGRGAFRRPPWKMSSATFCAPGFREECVEVPPVERSGEMIVRLARANRLEIALSGSCADARACHAVVRIPPSMRTRNFYQSKYSQTPGRPVEGTRGEFREGWRRDSSIWFLAFADGGLAVLDHLYDPGTVEVEAFCFDRSLGTASASLTAEGTTVRVAFPAPDLLPPLRGRALDEDGFPVPNAEVLLGPDRGCEDGDFMHDRHDPVWSPRARSGPDGRFTLPASRGSRDEVVLIEREGYADTVITIDELQAGGGDVVLRRGQVVLLKLVGRDGQRLSDDGRSTHGYYYTAPLVHIGHGVWRGASPARHPAGRGLDLDIPYFLFADLPAGTLRFRLESLDRECTFFHDTAVRDALYVAPVAADEMRYGK